MAVAANITSDHLGGTNMNPDHAAAVRDAIVRRTRDLTLRHELLDMLGLEET